MSNEPQVNAAKPKEVERATKNEEMARKQQRDDMKWLLADPRGLRIWERYIWGECHQFATSFTGSRSTDFLEGERNIGLKMLADLNEAAPEAYAAILQQRKERGL